MEFVRKGDSVDSWKELFEQQIIFTALPLRKSVDNWKASMLKADPKIELKEETIADDFIYLTYTSQSGEETGLRGFLRGKDAVYMIAYMVRPKLKNEETLKIWEKIIRKAKLVPNPEKIRPADGAKP